MYVHKINTSASVNGRAMGFIEAINTVEILKPAPCITNTYSSLAFINNI